MYVMFGWVGLGIVFTLGKTDELLKKILSCQCREASRLKHLHTCEFRWIGSGKEETH
jgi:hypothetical protein